MPSLFWGFRLTIWNVNNPNFSKIGVGVAQKSGGSIYWTQIFVG